MEFSSGFTALTGQTGAGKSVMISAVELLLGKKADNAMIRTGEDSATIIALFGDLSPEASAACTEQGFAPDEDGMLLVSRTISLEGRSGIRINGRTATTGVLKNLMPKLLNIHGQRDTQALLDPEKHLSFLDRYCDDGEAKAAYSVEYTALRELCREKDKITRDADEAKRNAALLRAQAEEIFDARLKPDEEEKLLEERRKLQSAELIGKQTSYAYRALRGGEKGNICMLLERSQTALESLSDALPQAADLARRMEACRYELEDVADLVYDLGNIGEGDPTERLNRVETRLDQIEKLKKRYGPEIKDVLAYGQTVKEKLDRAENLDIVLTELDRKIREQKERTETAGKKLSVLRRSGAAKMEKAVAKLLAYLDMPRVEFAAVFHDCEPGADGIETMQFCVRTNPGDPLTELAKTASGGETSRIMLALKCVLADRDGVQTLIFDEIDTGVSGGTSRKIGILLSQLSRSVQILAVTHSAQIASAADSQFSIVKSEKDGRSETRVYRLDLPGRVEEIARILGGIEVTDLQREAARQLLVRETLPEDIE